MNDDDYIKHFFTEEEVRRLDGEIRYEAGLKDGIEQNKKEMILKMHQNEVPIEIIAKSSNLTIQEVQDIINSNN